MEWYIKCLRNYVNFKGRARRKEFWMFILFNSIISAALIIISMMVSDSAVVYTIYYLVTALPFIAVCVRRLHDIDRSGWWFLLNMVPFGAFVLLWFHCKEGTSDNNRFGDNPKVTSTKNIIINEA